LTYSAVGQRLGITQSAVSQRAQAAGIIDEQRARALAEHLVADLLRTEETQ
jgi:predicted transcriptional regulator